MYLKIHPVSSHLHLGERNIPLVLVDLYQELLAKTQTDFGVVQQAVWTYKDNGGIAKPPVAREQKVCQPLEVRQMVIDVAGHLYTMVFLKRRVLQTLQEELRGVQLLIIMLLTKNGVFVVQLNLDVERCAQSQKSRVLWLLLAVQALVIFVACLSSI